MASNKVKITQKEFDEIYQIEDLEITEETKEVLLSAKPPEDTTPFLTPEEEEIDKNFHQDYPFEEEIKE